MIVTRSHTPFEWLTLIAGLAFAYAVFVIMAGGW